MAKKAKVTKRQRVLSASKLHITIPEHKALLKTRSLLKTKKVWHNPKPLLIHGWERPKEALVFNMGFWRDPAECGTVMCIGGYMQMLRPRAKDWAPSNALDELFYPSVNNWAKITKDQAIKAIDNFLASGDPNWKSVVKN